MKPDERYLQFPLFLLRDLFTDKQEAINQMLSYGIYKYSTKLQYESEAVARQIIYDNYRGNISYNIKKFISDSNCECIGKDVDYNGFAGSGFDPLDEIWELEELFESNPIFYNEAKVHYQMHEALKSLGIKGNINSNFERAKEIEKKVQKNEPMPMISKSHLFNYRDNEKSEFDLAQFSAYIAIRSILGVKPYCKTNKKHIVSRMFGYASHKHLPNKMNKVNKDLLNKYSNRYHIDKVLQALELNWNVITYSRNMRGLYVAIGNKITIENLVMTAETNKRKTQIKELKNKKQAAYELALQQLNKGQQLKKVKSA